MARYGMDAAAMRKRIERHKTLMAGLDVVSLTAAILLLFCWSLSAKYRTGFSLSMARARKSADRKDCVRRLRKQRSPSAGTKARQQNYAAKRAAGVQTEAFNSVPLLCARRTKADFVKVVSFTPFTPLRRSRLHRASCDLVVGNRLRAIVATNHQATPAKFGGCYCSRKRSGPRPIQR
jgi:hypothetical protein